MPAVTPKPRLQRHLAKRRFWIAVIATLCVAGLAAGAVILVLPRTQSGADFLVDRDDPVHADLIYLLGGNYDVRGPEAARLFNLHLAPRILLAREPGSPGGSQKNFTDTTVRILLDRGVPRDRIVQIYPSNGVRSTADEARALALYLRTYPAHTILVVTSPFHTRRARLALGRAITGGHQLRMIAAPGDCNPENWRETPSCRQAVADEWLKLGYYFVTFWG